MASERLRDRGVTARLRSPMPLAIVFETLEDGMTIDEVVEQVPVTREQGKAVLEFAARSLDATVPGLLDNLGESS